MSKFVRIASCGNALGVALPLATLLSMSVSHTAMAACGSVPSGITGVTVVCSDEDAANATANTYENDGTARTTAQNNASNAPDGTLALANNYAIAVALVKNGTIFQNNGTVFSHVDTVTSNSTTTGDNARAAVAVYTAQNEGEFTVINSGTIKAEHAGAGKVFGIDGDQTSDDINATEGMHVINMQGATISAARTGTFTVLNPGGGGNVSGTLVNTSNAMATVTNNLGVAAAVFGNEGVESFLIENNAGATIEGKGVLAAGIYTGGPSAYIVNDGVIKYTPTGQGGGVAISSNQEVGGETEDGERHINFGKTTIKNNEGAEIDGDIQVIDANGLRWMASRLPGGFDPNGGSLTSQQGRRDSQIENDGTINGTVYLGMGNHVFVNNGTLNGGSKNSSGASSQLAIDVDQRRNQNYATTNPASLPFSYQYYNGQGPSEGSEEEEDDASTKKYSNLADFLKDHPERYFELDTSKVIKGDVFVKTVVGPVVDIGQDGQSVTTPGSVVVLKTHITGSGTGSDLTNPSTNSAYIDGYLAIGTGTSPLGQSKLSNFTASTIDKTTTLTPVIDSTVRNSETFLIAKHLYGTALPEVSEDSYLVDWTAYQVGGLSGNALAIQASVKDASEIGGISAPGAAALNGLIAAGGDDPTLGVLGGAIESLSDEDDVRKAGEQLKPETNFATQQAAITLNNAVGQHIETRLASAGGAPSFAPVTPGPSGLGMRPSEEGRSNLGASYKDDPDFVAPRSAALWGQAFGAGLDQDRRDLVDGYSARLYGILAGYDNWVAPGFRLGIAGGYANTNIDGKGDTRQNETGIDSYLVEAYGSIKGSGWYATGRTGFTWHDYDTTRVLTVPFSDSAKGSHDGRQYNAAIEFGTPMRTVGAIITPVASLTYSHLNQDAYTETSGAGMALSVAGQSNDSVVSGLGLKALVPIANDTVLEGRAQWLHEFSDTSQIVTASFAAGGGTFTAAGPNVGRDSADLGAGLVAQIDQSMSFQMNYDANVRQDFLAHIGSARLNVNF